MKHALRRYEHDVHGGAKLLDARRLLNQMAFRGGTVAARRALQLYTQRLPGNTKLDQVVMPSRSVPSHFFRYDSAQQYAAAPVWADMRPNSETHNFNTKKDLALLRLHYKVLTMDDPDAHDARMHQLLTGLASKMYAGRQLACVLEAINYLTLNEFGADACGRANPDEVLAKFVCRLGFDGWIRLGNTRSISQASSQVPRHVTDEVYICNLDHVTWTGPRA